MNRHIPLLLTLLASTALLRADPETGFDRFELVPKPERLELNLQQEVALTNGTPVALRTARDSAACAAWVTRHIRDWFGITPTIRCEPLGKKMPTEAYRLYASPTLGLTFEAEDIVGIRHALSTLRQLAIPRRGTALTQDYILPGAAITDAPRLTFRGIHLCWFPGVTEAAIERYIRFAALLKYNTVILESWGTFRSRRHPWTAWPDAAMTHEAIARLRTIADDLGITLVPALNAWGHAAYSRLSGAKHAILDFHPERQVLFEPDGGWVWCLSNPTARQTVLDLVDELHEAFGRPPYFHIGLDEAYNAPHCPQCRKEGYINLVSRHIHTLAQHLSKHHARILLWHDMLLDPADKKWKGFVATGNPQTAALIDTLPKDAIICDWFYGGYWGFKQPDNAYPTLDYFQSKGFDTLTAPWDNLEGIRAQGKWAADHHLFGYLQTTWHHLRGFALLTMFCDGACASWGHGTMPQAGSIRAGLLRFATWDTRLTNYTQTGSIAWDVNPLPDNSLD